METSHPESRNRKTHNIEGSDPPPQYEASTNGASNPALSTTTGEATSRSAASSAPSADANDGTNLLRYNMGPQPQRQQAGYVANEPM